MSLKASLMIDWLTVVLKIKHKPFDAGTIVSLDDSGVMEWETKKYYHAEGSHETSIQLKSQGYLFDDRECSELYISGNPSKFLLGHNVYGSDNCVALIAALVRKLFTESNRPIEPKAWQKILTGHFEVKTIDITGTFDAGSQLNVRQWLDSAALQSRTRHGTPTTKGGTVYWGQNSTHQSTKAYSKYEEITSKKKKHRLAETLSPEFRDKLIAWTEGKIRLEHRLHARRLKKAKVNCGRYLKPETLIALYYEYLEKIDMSRQTKMTDDMIEGLPQKLRGTYMLWREGFNIQQSISKATYFRHKKELIKYGVDISIPMPKKNDNIVPLVKIIELKPCGLPDFADDVRELEKNYKLEAVS